MRSFVVAQSAAGVAAAVGGIEDVAAIVAGR